MGYQEQASGINKDLKSLLERVKIENFSNEQREMLLNLFCRFGQVCKFRCRSNVAYDGFVNCCFDGLAIAKRVKTKPEDEWETLRAELNK